MQEERICEKKSILEFLMQANYQVSFKNDETRELTHEEDNWVNA